MEAVNPNMIILARESRGWSQAELAGRIGISAANLSKIERAEIRVQTATIQKIVTVTNYPHNFFLQSGKILPVNLAYRKRKRTPQKIITRIESRCNIIQKHIQFLSRALGKNAPKITPFEVSDGQSPVIIAQKTRALLQVTDPVIRNLTALIESAEIPVAQFDFGTEQEDCHSILTEDKYPLIVLNNALLGDRQRYILAFEYGHLIMHTFLAVSNDRDVNREADQFAAEFLMPAIEIRKDFQAPITVARLGDLKRKWKVSMLTLLHRAYDLGFLTPNQKRYLLQQFNQSKIKRCEPPEFDVQAESPTLIQKWLKRYRAAQQTGFGEKEMAETLFLSEKEYVEMYYS